MFTKEFLSRKFQSQVLGIQFSLSWNNSSWEKEKCRCKVVQNKIRKYFDLRYFYLHTNDILITIYAWYLVVMKDEKFMIVHLSYLSKNLI